MDQKPFKCDKPLDQVVEVSEYNESDRELEAAVHPEDVTGDATRDIRNLNDLLKYDTLQRHHGKRKSTLPLIEKPKEAAVVQMAAMDYVIAALQDTPTQKERDMTALIASPRDETASPYLQAQEDVQKEREMAALDDIMKLGKELD